MANEEALFKELYSACCKRDTETVETVLNQKNVDMQKIVCMRDQNDGSTALHMAADEGLHEVVKKLLEKKSPVQAVDSDGLNVLHWALRGGKSPKLVQMLLEREDCFPLYDQSANEEGFTPFICGLKNGSIKTVKVLLDLDSQMTPWSAQMAHRPCYKLDLKRYKEANQNIYLLVMQLNDVDLIKLLLDKDENWQEQMVTTEDGKNALLIAAEKKLWTNVETVMVDFDLSLTQSNLELLLVEVVKESNLRLLDRILTKEFKRGTL